MYSMRDTPKGWVAPFGHPGIKACSQLPRAFRSVPRPSSPPGAKASTRCPSHAHTSVGALQGTDPPTMHRNHPRLQAAPIRARKTRRTPSPTAGQLTSSLSTHINASEHCSRASTQSRRRPLAETATCPGSDTHAGTATGTKEQPRTNPHTVREARAARDALRAQRRTRT